MLGLVWIGLSRWGSRGNAQLGVVGSGTVRQLWKGLSRRGPFRFVEVRKAVIVSYVEAARGRFRFCKAVVARMAAHVAVTCRPLRYGCLGS